MDLGFNLAQSNRDLKDPTSRQIFGDTSGLLCKNDLILRRNQSGWKSSLMLPVGELHKAPHQRPLRNVESPRGKSLTGDSNDSIKPSFLSPSSSSSSPSSPLPSCAVFLHRILYDTSVQQGQTERGESKGLLCNTSLKSKNAAGSHRTGGVI